MASQEQAQFIFERNICKQMYMHIHICSGRKQSQKINHIDIDNRPNWIILVMWSIMLWHWGPTTGNLNCWQKKPWTIGGKPVKCQPLAAYLRDSIAKRGLKNKTSANLEITFVDQISFTPLAESQKWGVSTSRGYQNKLGLGKCTDAVNFQDCAAVKAAQLWMRSFFASLHGCLPEELCWQPDGVSFKAGHTHLLKLSWELWNWSYWALKGAPPLHLKTHIINITGAEMYTYIAQIVQPAHTCTHAH